MNFIPHEHIFKLMTNIKTYSNCNKINFIPNEVILIIFEFILKITDKRQFLKTCKHYNTITKESFRIYEYNYKIKDFDKINDYCMEKFTLELCHDKYFETIPKKYLIPTNKIIMEQYPCFGDIKFSKLREIKSYNYRIYNIFFDIGTNGLVQILKLMKENGCNNRRFIGCIHQAIGNGQLEVLKYIKSTGYNWGDLNYIYAIENGHLHILKWAKETGSRLIISICANAASYGQLEILKWARKNGHNWGRNICRNAAQNGHLHVLKWAVENGCSWNYETCAAAASNGNIEILTWAINNGLKLSKYACSEAAKYGQLECLKWLRFNGCEWDKYTCYYAAEKGQLECLKWARNNGCEWDHVIYIYGSRHPKILRWVSKNGCPKI